LSFFSFIVGAIILCVV